MTGAEGAGASRINEVDITVGVLTEVMEDALQFAWEALTRGHHGRGCAVLNVTMLDARDADRVRRLAGTSAVHDASYSGARVRPSWQRLLMRLSRAVS